MSQLLYKLFSRVTLFVCVAVITVVNSPVAFGITSSALEGVLNNRPLYDPTHACETGTATPSTSGGGGATGSVYVLGDSITNQSTAKYETALSSKGFSGNTINGSDGRSIEIRGLTSGRTTTGTEAVAGDEEKVKSASKIVVALGTNGGVESDKISALVSQIKSLNGNAQLFWVDTMVIGRPGYVPTINASNTAIYDNSATSGYEIISWAKKVTPSANPKQLTGSEQDAGGYIRQSDQFVHLTPAGEDALTQLVADGISSSNGGSDDTQDLTCASPCSAGNIEFEDGEIERLVFQFFVSVGLTAEQTAGIMGNMAHESGFRPQRLQGTGRDVVTPANEVPRGQGAKAWGLVQWDPAHKLIDPVTAAGKDPNNPKIQLDYLWGQLNNEWPEGWPGSAPSGGFNEKAAGDRVKAATTVEEATRAFATYERFAGYENPNHERYTGRIAAAKAAFDTYRDLAPSAGGVSGGGDCNEGPSIEGIEYPEGMEPHPRLGGEGYYKIPENDAYSLNGPENKRYGSRALIGAIYTVGKAYKAAMGGDHIMSVGNLNTRYRDPSVSHRWGVAVDLSGTGQQVAANRTRPGYSTNATITLGKLWVDTGMVKNIWWCPEDNSSDVISNHANSRGTPIVIRCQPGHADHFHIDLKDEFRLVEADTY